MQLCMYIIDAFTREQFGGNSAAVVVLDSPLSDALMQQIASENNLSETAFIIAHPSGDYAIRWFSPLMEIDFCGHATLASAFVLFEYFQCHQTIRFTTQQVGDLTVWRHHDGCIEMRFPNLAPTAAEAPPALLAGLSRPPKQVLANAQAYFAIYDDEQDVISLQSNSEQLKTLAPRDVVVSAKGSDCDFVSRYFWPANGGDEDPVTGSIHAGLTPYWAEQLGKTKFHAKQKSIRGGELFCSLDAEHVLVSGYAVLYAQSTLHIATAAS
tara:strand:+ start:1419 stop:2222 length:804 start_codon:yes stop_codon:yes gene_type:complete